MSDSRPPTAVNTPHPRTPPLLSLTEYAASRHGVWLTAAALITDELGRIRLQQEEILEHTA